MSVTYRVAFSDDPSSTLQDAGAHLESDPVRHNLVHTLLTHRARDPEPGRYWIVSAGADVVGVVFQSPLDWRASLTPMPAGAAQAAAAGIAEQGIALPEVEGEAATAAAFAGRWTEVCHTGAAPVLGMRLHQLGTLTQPTGVPGQLRPAGDDDINLIQRWAISFTDDVEEARPDPAQVASRVTRGQMALWVTDSGPVCMSGLTPPVGGVVRVGPVYTPPEHRRLGYAGACVGLQSQAAVDDGLTCILYTDLTNATSNSVYRALGYRVVAEVTRYAFDDSRNS